MRSALLFHKFEFATGDCLETLLQGGKESLEKTAETWGINSTVQKVNNK